MARKISGKVYPVHQNKREEIRRLKGEIKRLLKMIQKDFTAQVEKLPQPNHVGNNDMCIVASAALGLVLNYHLNISLSDKDRVYLKIQTGKEKRTGIYHWWLALIVDGRKILFIDPSYFQFDVKVKGRIVITGYNIALKKLKLMEAEDEFAKEIAEMLLPLSETGKVIGDAGFWMYKLKNRLSQESEPNIREALCAVLLIIETTIQGTHFSDVNRALPLASIFFDISESRVSLGTMTALAGAA